MCDMCDLITHIEREIRERETAEKTETNEND
jgi:hypothetical protein